MRVEFDVMAQDFFMDVLVDDFRLVPTPPGSVSPGPLAPDAVVDMGLAAVMPTLQNTSATFMMSSVSSYGVSSTESLVAGSSSTGELDLTLMKVLESATQTPVPSLTTLAVETEAPATTQASAGSAASSSTDSASAPGASTGTGPVVQNQASQDHTTVSNALTTDLSYQTAPVSSPAPEAPKPPPTTDTPIDLSAAAGPVVETTNDSNWASGQEFTFDATMALVFNPDEVSAWDVVNSPETAMAAPQEIGLAKELSGNFSSGDSFVLSLDSLRLTEFLV